MENPQKKIDCELTASIVNNKCDIYLNGTTTDLVSCMCATIKALALRIIESMKESNPEEYNEYIESMGISEDVMEDYMVAMIIAYIMSDLEIVGCAEDVTAETISNMTNDTTKPLDFSNLETFIKKDLEDNLDT